MGQSAEELKADIARRRDDMSMTLDSLGDRVSPRQIARRRTERVSRWAAGTRTAVMGSVGDLYAGGRRTLGSTAGRVEDAASGLGSAPGAMMQQTRGNPLAAGLVTFGLGLLLGSLPPASRGEQRLATTLAEPVVGEAGRAAGELAGGMKESAKDAAGEIRTVAEDAVDQVKGQASAAAKEVKEGLTQR
ncbi:MAG: hypothetical protein JWM85_2516 [Acidimicrobiaceae bacterium]|nr:hypothetical protein [Acidimicrobiaceae bacterium]